MDMGPKGERRTAATIRRSYRALRLIAPDAVGAFHTAYQLLKVTHCALLLWGCDMRTFANAVARALVELNDVHRQSKKRQQPPPAQTKKPTRRILHEGTCEINPHKKRGHVKIKIKGGNVDAEAILTPEVISAINEAAEGRRP